MCQASSSQPAPSLWLEAPLLVRTSSLPLTLAELLARTGFSGVSSHPILPSPETLVH